METVSTVDKATVNMVCSIGEEVVWQGLLIRGIAKGGVDMTVRNS